MIKIVKSFFNSQVKLLELEKHSDKRGYFVESYNYKDLKKIGISKSFFQDNESFSKNIGIEDTFFILFWGESKFISSIISIDSSSPSPRKH